MMLSPDQAPVSSLVVAVAVTVVAFVAITSTSTSAVSFVIGIDIPVQHHQYQYHQRQYQRQEQQQQEQQQDEVDSRGSCSFTNTWTGKSCMEFRGNGWTVDLMKNRCAIETESTLTLDDDDNDDDTTVVCSDSLSSLKLVAGFCVNYYDVTSSTMIEATLMMITSSASEDNDNSNAEAECDTTIMACETFMSGIFEYGPACQNEQEEVEKNENDTDTDAGGGRPSSSSSSSSSSSGPPVRETNTVCDTSPDALTKSLLANIVTTTANDNDNNNNNNNNDYSRVVDHTCIESTGYVGQRCFYTYIPECATMNSPLVYDIHGVSLCPLWNFDTTGWIQKSIENCFVVVWPLGNIDPTLSAFSCFALAGGYNVTEAANNHKKHRNDTDSDNATTDTDTDTDTAIPGMEYQTDDCCCFNFGPNVENPPSLFDDMTFLRNIATVLVQELVPDRTNGIVSIDTTRIYFGGHSNGCTAGLAMAAAHSDLVSAVCCHAPALISPFPNLDAASSESESSYTPVPIFLVHGKLDGTVDYDGTFPSGTQIGKYNPGAEQMNTMLGTVNNCTSTTTSRVDGRDNMTNSTTTSRLVGSGSYTYHTQQDCHENTTVTLLALEQAGHTPFFQAELFMGDKEGTVMTTVDTTQHAWDFCSGYSKEVAPILELMTPPPTTTTTTTTTTAAQEDDTNDGSSTSSTSTSNSSDDTTLASEQEEEPSNTTGTSAASTTTRNEHVVVFSLLVVCVVPTFFLLLWNY